MQRRRASHICVTFAATNAARPVTAAGQLQFARKPAAVSAFCLLATAACAMVTDTDGLVKRNTGKNSRRNNEAFVPSDPGLLCTLVREDLSARPAGQTPRSLHEVQCRNGCQGAAILA